MPELPEVEVCRLGITPHLIHQKISEIIVRQRQLRWPIPLEVEHAVGEVITQIDRRAKYLILKTAKGSIILHLGMSGTLRVVSTDVPLKTHDHVDIVMANGLVLRLNDPRRFGAMLWLPDGEDGHEVLGHLGPEPLSDDFDAPYLITKVNNKQTPIKTLLMNNKIVVGVGNIYANEALFLASINPLTKAGEVSEEKLTQLVPIIKTVLTKAITQGGTTLKDFRQSDGKPGYFAQELNVYGKAGKPCPACSNTLTEVRISGRSTVFCENCQPI